MAEDTYIAEAGELDDKDVNPAEILENNNWIETGAQFQSDAEHYTSPDAEADVYVLDDTVLVDVEEYDEQVLGLLTELDAHVYEDGDEEGGIPNTDAEPVEYTPVVNTRVTGVGPRTSFRN